MPGCAYCEFSGEKLFEDSSVIAALPPNPLVPGHVVVFPKQHVQILEQAPDEVVARIFEIANKMSVAMFEGLRAQGTNLVLMNGLAAGQKVSHIAVDVVPRVKDDGLGFVWPSRKLSDEQMGLVELQVKEQVLELSAIPQSSSLQPAETADAEEEKAREDEQTAEKPGKKMEDPFIRQLRRMP